MCDERLADGQFFQDFDAEMLEAESYTDAELAEMLADEQRALDLLEEVLKVNL